MDACAVHAGEPDAVHAVESAAVNVWHWFRVEPGIGRGESYECGDWTANAMLSGLRFDAFMPGGEFLPLDTDGKLFYDSLHEAMEACSMHAGEPDAVHSVEIIPRLPAE